MGFTTLINQNWSETERVNLMEKMWRVVYADGRLDDHELHLMRKIQRLLHIPPDRLCCWKITQQAKYPLNESMKIVLECFSITPFRR